jgi:S-adenosylmethionine hydrolase
MAIVTLTSDFGQQDYLAGAVKGRVVSASDAFRIVDICHSVAPFNAQHAAYVCRNAFPHFPQGTYHMVLVDLFDAGHDYFLLARKDGSHVAIADNGLLGLFFDDGPDEVVSVTLSASRPRDVLHIADAMAGAFRRLSEGETLLDIGDPGVSVRFKGRPTSRTDDDWMEGHVIHIDPFENVVVDITRERFEAQRKGRPFQISFLRNEWIDRLSDSYADVPEGEKLALFNAAGYLEIAVNKGKASGLFGLQPRLEGASDGRVRPLQRSHFYHIVRVRFG